jgi:hypothetical protein
MDTSFVGQLVRRLSVGDSRRGALRLLTGGMAAALGEALHGAAASPKHRHAGTDSVSAAGTHHKRCVKTGHKCQQSDRCCGGQGHYCAFVATLGDGTVCCKAGGVPCSSNDECCGTSNSCSGGFCYAE